MPPALQTQAASRRPNVTAVIGRHTALSLDVCKADGLVAIHAHTACGVVIFTLAEAEFIAKARGPLDSNDNPWRPSGALVKARLEELDAAATAPKYAPPAPVTTPLPAVAPLPRSRSLYRAARGAAAVACAEAWQWHRQNPHLTHAEVASKFFLQPGSYSTWLSRKHPGELRRLRITAGLSAAPRSNGVPAPRPPVLKPGGHIL